MKGCGLRAWSMGPRSLRDIHGERGVCVVSSDGRPPSAPSAVGAGAYMRRGFLLPSDKPVRDEESILLQPVYADECPVCLDSLSMDSALLLTCRHMLCSACLKSLWRMRREANPATGHLECPVCRSLVKVANGDLAAFAAAHTACHFIGPPRTPRRRAPTDESGLHSLTVPELKALVSHLGLQASVSGELERDEIEHAIAAALPSPPLGSAEVSPISRLAVRSLRAILELRAIPHDDCVEKPELVQRVLQSARGSCMSLPKDVLLRMHAMLSRPEETPAEDQIELARRVMAARALRRAHAAQRAAEAMQASTKQAAGQSERHRTAAYGRGQPHAAHPHGEAEPEPPRTMHCCCVVS